MADDELPRHLGFRMPAEWEPHAATWLAWPHNPRDWPGKFSAIPWVFGEIVRHLHRHERVRVVVADAQHEGRARRVLEKVAVDFAQVDFFRFPTDRSWLRDSGPIFVRNESEIAATCWRFNAWAKYDNWRKDVKIPKKIAHAAKVRTWQPRFNSRPIVLEGGSIDVNGQGALLTTEECLLSDTQQRNPGLGREQLEQILSDYLGIRKVLWLGQGIAGDDTHGHIDDLARFVGPRTVVTVVEPDPADENHIPLQENLRRLRAMADQDGQPLEVVELPMPRPLYFQNQRVPASYANFYIANGVVLVPTFNDANDRLALNTLAAAFPGREIIGIHSVDYVWGFGTLHCSTQQEPAIQPSGSGAMSS
jgi:agmatine deiminase